MTSDEYKDLKERYQQLREEMVTQAEFATVRGIAYGLAGITLVAVLGAILQLVIK